MWIINQDRTGIYEISKKIEIREGVIMAWVEGEWVKLGQYEDNETEMERIIGHIDEGEKAMTMI